MSDQHFLKCHCQHCGSPIEFPPEGVGLKLDCPHCGQRTLLCEAAASLEADPLQPQPHDGEPSAPVSPVEPLAQPGKKSRLPAGVLAALALVALAGGGWYFLAGPGAKQPEASFTEKPEPPTAKKSEPEPPVAKPVAANPPTNAPAAEFAESSNSAESSQKPTKSIDDLKASAVTLEKAKAGSLIHAVGTIKNMSDQQRFGVRVELELTDARGNPAGKASDYTQVIEPRQEWRFRALVVDTGRTKAVTARVSSIKEDN